MKNKKILKITTFLTATTLTLGTLWFANGLLGNPISKHLAKTSAEKYMIETYGDTDFILDEVKHDFKTGRYYAKISSPSSIDSYFSFDINLFGEVQRDYYESNVLDGYNTFIRCKEGYHELVNEVFLTTDFPYESDLKYGSFENTEYLMNSLELDQEFDYVELGKTYGEITFYTKSEDVTLEKASEILLGIREIFDEKEVYFYQINFILENLLPDEDKSFERSSIYIYNFLYDDIYKEGMLERVTKANEEANAYVE